MINMSALKPMFLDFLLFSSIFLGLVFYWTTCLLRGDLAKTSTMALEWFTIPKQYRVLLELHITQGQLESPEKQNAAQLTVVEKTLSNYCTTTRTQFVPILQNIPYLLLRSSTIVLRAALFSGPYEESAENVRLCLFSREAITRVFWFRFC